MASTHCRPPGIPRAAAGAGDGSRGRPFRDRRGPPRKSATARPLPCKSATAAGSSARRLIYHEKHAWNNPTCTARQPRGYCAGVDRAVNTVEKALELYGAPVYVRKQIVHNKHVVEALEARGAVFVDETDEVPEGAIVVFSAHGVAPSVHEEARAADLRTIDATCPLVTKVHHEARRFAARGLRHPADRPRGPRGGRRHDRRGAGAHHLVDGPGDGAGSQVRDPAKVAWLSQTTLSVDETNETVDALRRAVPAADSTRPATTSATPPRTGRRRSRRSPRESDLVIVVGSRNSSNSVRLVEVAPRRRRRCGPPGRRRRGRSTRPGWRARHGRGDQRRVRAGGPGRRRARASRRAAASTMSKRSRQRRSGWSSRCHTNCGRRPPR